MPDGVVGNFLANLYHGVGGNIKIYDAAATDDCVRAYSARANDYGPARNPSTVRYHDAPVQLLTRDLAIRSFCREVMCAC